VATDRSYASAAREWTWQLARILGAVALGAFFIALIATRMKGAWGSYAAHFDHPQAVWQYWRYHVDGAVPPGHLFTDHQFAVHGQLGWWAMMATLSRVVEPLTSAKVLEVVTFALLGGAAVFSVGARREWLLGIAAGFLILRSPDLAGTVAGGYARSFGPGLFLCFFGAFLLERHRACLLVLVLQAAIYPSIVIPCGITYGAYCVIKGPWRDRARRIGELVIAGLFIIGFGLSHNLGIPEWWGPIVTYEEAEQMRAWRRPGGRYGDVPFQPAWQQISANIERGFKPLGGTLAPASISDFVEAHRKATLIVVPSALSFAIIAVDRIRRRRRKLPVPDDMRVPWQLFALAGGAIAGYFFTRTFAFKFYLPSRQLSNTVQYLIMVGLPILCWCASRALFGSRRAVALVAAVLVSVAPAFALRGHGLAKSPFPYTDHPQDIAMHQRLRQLPLDAIVACDAYWCDRIGLFAYHRPYAAKSMVHPLRRGYYVEAERRLVEMHKALYANRLEDVVAFADREDVDYFVYSKARVTKALEATFEPAKTKIKNAWKKASEAGSFALLDPPKEAVLFRAGDVVLLDISKLKEHLLHPPLEQSLAPEPAR
jgi:hypothetical protein